MTTDFEEKLAETARTWRTENAPKDIATCPNCRHRKHNPDAGAEGSDYWDCIVEIALPSFAFSRETHRHSINLKHFDPAAPYAERLNQMACPLFDAATGDAP